MMVRHSPSRGPAVVIGAFAAINRTLANAAPTRQARVGNQKSLGPRRKGLGPGRGAMKASGTLLIAAFAVACAAGSLRAQTAQSTEPIEIAKLPYIEIFSPTFFWNDDADFVRTGSTTTNWNIV